MATDPKIDDRVIRGITQSNGDVRNIRTDDNGLLLLGSGTFAPPSYDDIVLGYTGANLTSVIYKLLGSTVRTLSLSYAGSKLTEVAVV